MLHDELEQAKAQNDHLQNEITMLQNKIAESNERKSDDVQGDVSNNQPKKGFNVPKITIPANPIVVAESPSGNAKSALRKPVSPGGRQLNRRLVKDLDLPEEAWAEDMAAMQAQLVECLEELLSKEELVKALKQDLLKYERDMEVMCDQTALLYAEYAEEKQGLPSYVPII